MPGDTILVHAGVYREEVSSSRGGRLDSQRIIYGAAPEEKVAIKGSEIITGWERVGAGIWKRVISDSYFGAFNPYKEKIFGDWYFGRGFHTSEVYLNIP